MADKIMASNPAQPLIDLKPTKGFFIGIDSDGCAFDTMEIKHKECFIPNIIKHFRLQAVSRFAREAAEFVNLYSKWRGINRFPAVEMVLDLLEQRPEVQEREVAVPRMAAMRAWIAHEKRPANPALKAAIAVMDAAANGDAKAELERVLAWSEAVNASVADIVYGVPPFPHVRESLEKAFPEADMIVVSATPGEALVREWTEHDIARYVRVIAGQEMGKKADHLRLAAAGKYPNNKVLMIGDAPGDLEAARANHARFYPINPGDEAASWKRFHDEALDRFFAGEYQGEYEDSLVEDFLRRLPDTPPWSDR
ncbi:MAG: HAD hydrolase-like protein [Verrucomicrobia bacterium]|nr:HAD hydrolase-like protein [Verrucomicrobiota bacterium]